MGRLFQPALQLTIQEKNGPETVRYRTVIPRKRTLFPGKNFVDWLNLWKLGYLAQLLFTKAGACCAFQP
jgi:hypothetical protein